jgi:hypothetical protein
MTKRVHGSLFADNKDICDLLSSHKVFKKELLRELAFERGIVLSSRDSLEALVQYFSLLPLDNALVERLLDMAAPPERYPASTMRRLALSAALDDVFSGAEVVRDHRAKSENEEVKVTQRGDTVRITITYAHLDPSRTRLQQERVQEAQIEIEVGKEDLLIRATPGPRPNAYMEQLVELLKSDAPAPTLVDLSHIRTAKLRTKFFLTMLTSMGEYATMEVTDLRVHPLSASDNEEDENDDSDEEAPAGKRLPKIEQRMTAQLANASLEGSNLLTSPIYQELTKGEFCITSLQWLVKHKKTLDEASLQAWFHDPGNAKDFRYRVRTFAESGGSHQRPDAQRGRELLKAIENAAETSLKALASKGDDSNVEDK